jgi:3-oxoadipate enol-lactonase
MTHLDLGDGFRLYYEVHGPEHADTWPILFAHGAGGNAMVWWQQVPAFADRYRVITFDHRAFGRSPDIEGGPGRVAFGSDLRALLVHLGVEQVHFVAHSMGGRTAFGLFSREPGMVASFVFSGTNAGCVDDRYRALREQFGEDGTLDGTLLERATAEDYEGDSPEMHFLYHQIRGLNPRRPRNFLAPTGRMVNYRGSTAPRLRESGLPVLWIVGEHDRVTPPALIRISHEITPGSRYVTVPGAGHSSYFERPAEWNRRVRAFIDGVEAGRRG